MSLTRQLIDSYRSFYDSAVTVLFEQYDDLSAEEKTAHLEEIPVLLNTVDQITLNNLCRQPQFVKIDTLRYRSRFYAVKQQWEQAIDICFEGIAECQKLMRTDEQTALAHLHNLQAMLIELCNFQTNALISEKKWDQAEAACLNNTNRYEAIIKTNSDCFISLRMLHVTVRYKKIKWLEEQGNIKEITSACLQAIGLCEKTKMDSDTNQEQKAKFLNYLYMNLSSIYTLQSLPELAQKTKKKGEDYAAEIKKLQQAKNLATPVTAPVVNPTREEKEEKTDTISHPVIIKESKIPVEEPTFEMQSNEKLIRCIARYKKSKFEDARNDFISAIQDEVKTPTKHKMTDFNLVQQAFDCYFHCEKHLNSSSEEKITTGPIDCMLKGHEYLRKGLSKIDKKAQARQAFISAIQAFSQPFDMNTGEEDSDNFAFLCTSTQIFFDRGLAYFYIQDYAKAMENFDLAIWVSIQQQHHAVTEANMLEARQSQLDQIRYRLNKALVCLEIGQIEQSDLEKQVIDALFVDLFKQTKSKSSKRSETELASLQITTPMETDKIIELHRNLQTMLTHKFKHALTEMKQALDFIYTTNKDIHEKRLTAKAAVEAPKAEVKATPKIETPKKPKKKKQFEDISAIALPAEEPEKAVEEAPKEEKTATKDIAKKSAQPKVKKLNAKQRKDAKRKALSKINHPKKTEDNAENTEIETPKSSINELVSPLSAASPLSDDTIFSPLSAASECSTPSPRTDVDSLAFPAVNLTPTGTTASAPTVNVVPETYFLSHRKTQTDMRALPGIDAFPDKVKTTTEIFDPYAFACFCLSQLNARGAVLSFAVGGLVGSALSHKKDPSSKYKGHKRIVDIDLTTEADVVQIKAALAYDIVARFFPSTANAMITPIVVSEQIDGLCSFTITFADSDLIYKVQVKQSEFLKKNSNGTYQQQDPLREDALSRDCAHSAAYFDQHGNFIIPLKETLVSFANKTIIVLDKKDDEINEEKSAELRSFKQDFKRALRVIAHSATKGFKLSTSTSDAICTTLDRLAIDLYKEVKKSRDIIRQIEIARTINIFMQEQVFAKKNSSVVWAELDSHGVFAKLYKTFAVNVPYRSKYHDFIHKQILAKKRNILDVYACLILLENQNVALLKTLSGDEKSDAGILLKMLKDSMSQNKMYQLCFDDFVANKLAINKDLKREDILLSVLYRNAYEMKEKLFPQAPKKETQAPAVVSIPATAPLITSPTASQPFVAGGLYTAEHHAAEAQARFFPPTASMPSVYPAMDSQMLHVSHSMHYSMFNRRQRMTTTTVSGTRSTAAANNPSFERKK